MGYLIQPNKFVTYQFTIDALDVQNCGTNQIPLIDLTPNAFDGEIFFPLFSSLRIVNQSIPYNFGSQSHISLQSGGNIFMIWQTLLNNMSPDQYAYTSLYTQKENNYSGPIYTGNVDPQKVGQILSLNTLDNGDATFGDGQLIVTINGFKTKV